MSGFSTADIPDLAGWTVIVTGANSGIGLETAKANLLFTAELQRRLTEAGSPVLSMAAHAIRPGRRSTSPF